MPSQYEESTNEKMGFVMDNGFQDKNSFKNFSGEKRQKSQNKGRFNSAQRAQPNSDYKFQVDPR